ncbi:hypothetical protein ACFQ4Y_03000 [Kroppenstedtia sanguinis]|uniref:Uncharacterized protein n=1 Tax=Kroppenstedtia sanguinis TaxID=1380684 RepID=A0ABW4C6N4_9BACL
MKKDYEEKNNLYAEVGKSALHNYQHDQCSQFTSDRYFELFQDRGVQISMDGRGQALDPALAIRKI